MFFFAFGKDEEEARNRFLAEYGSTADVGANALVRQIAASKPFVSDIKNGTFGIRLNIQAQPVV